MSTKDDEISGQAAAEDKYSVLFDIATKSFEEIVQEVADDTPQVCEPFDIDAQSSLSVIIGITSEINGRILINSSTESANNLAVAMNFGDPLDNEDDLFVYLAEFANMSCGRMTTYINDKYGQRVVWIAPPAIFSADNLKIVTPHITTRKQYYNTAHGKFIIDVGYNDGSQYDGF